MCKMRRRKSFRDVYAAMKILSYGWRFTYPTFTHINLWSVHMRLRLELSATSSMRLAHMRVEEMDAFFSNNFHASVRVLFSVVRTHIILRRTYMRHPRGMCAAKWKTSELRVNICRLTMLASKCVSVKCAHVCHVFCVRYFVEKVNQPKTLTMAQTYTFRECWKVSRQAIVFPLMFGKNAKNCLL